MKYEKLAQTNRMQALNLIDEVSFILHTSYLSGNNCLRPLKQQRLCEI